MKFLHPQKYLLWILTLISLSACSDLWNTRDQLLASWVRPMEGREDYQCGFTLEEEGFAYSVNSYTERYHSWSASGDILVLNGRHILEGESKQFSDTLRISKLDDSSLVLVDSKGSEIHYTRAVNVAKVIQAFEDPMKCYRAIGNGDTIELSLVVEHQLVEGELKISSRDVGKSHGTIQGSFKGDTLIWDFEYNDLGRTSISQVAFLKRGQDLIQGYGEMDQSNGMYIFNDVNNIEFIHSFALRRVYCPGH